MKNTFLTSLAALGLVVGAGGAQAVPITADIATLVDESGSMSTEHAWLPDMISDLNTGLVNAGLTNNRYAKVGFGGHVSGDAPHKHLEGGSEWFAASTYDNDFVTSGGTEDGWNAIDFFFDNYTPRSDAALNLILVTDEDRDNQNTALSYSGILSRITGAGALLNAVVDATFECGNGTPALGITVGGIGYVADGSGGFTTCTGASAVSGDAGGSSGVDTIPAYVNLALATGGAAWDLNKLRAGGLLATSFTNAFVDIKVEEIKDQTPTGVPGPPMLALFGLGLLGLAGSLRLRRNRP